MGHLATLPPKSYRRKLFDGLVTSLAMDLSTLATLKLLNSLKVTLTLGLNQSTLTLGLHHSPNPGLNPSLNPCLGPSL